MPKRKDRVAYTDAHGVRSVVHPSWYRGEHCNFMPPRKAEEFPDFIEEYILRGWLPEKPLIGKSDVVTSFGSCFAMNITAYLEAKGYTVGRNVPGALDTHIVTMGAGIVNTATVLQQLQWALLGKDFNEALWYGSKAELAPATEEIRKATRELLLKTEVFIITLGLSEVWCNKKTSEVFWRAIPQEVFDPEVHGFKVLSASENERNLLRIEATIRQTTGLEEAHIIYTLSPVALTTTFRSISCITANEASKANLRAALDHFFPVREGVWGPKERTYYWPAYEIVRFTHDAYQLDNRHPKAEVIRKIMDLFERYYCKGEQDA